MITYLLLPVMLVSLSFYIYSVYRCRLRTRVISKAITSTVFIAVAVLACWAGNSNRSYFAFILTALILCTFGDVFLEISKHDALGINYFVYALSAFFAAHVAFLFLFCRFTGVYPLDFFATAAILIVLVVAAKLMRLDFFNMESYVFAYAIVVTFMFVKSLSLIYGGHSYSVRNVLVASGAGLFLLSNAVYSLVLFRKKSHPALRAVSAAVYYTGQTLIALSVLFAGG
ncbi:lysoplasmalogenase [Hydrogenoanaerobacterium sp.]|uniref:lysoplasmalogenase n=1 Tax=Hydrogenoanaerobacterium sp. TaxID=2953763 RepID=UPI0028A19EFA|nr:lysoplasmalogenase [Hydrogenoanaerobacterium sp.]